VAYSSHVVLSDVFFREATVYYFHICNVLCLPLEHRLNSFALLFLANVTFAYCVMIVVD
jgi:hypothetical protein